MHICYDYDRTQLPLPTSDQSTKSLDLAPPLDRLWSRIKRLPLTVINIELGAVFPSFFIYMLFLRRYAWAYSLWFARLFWSISSTSQPSGILPDFVYLLWRSFASGVLLLFFWESSNEIFSAYVAQEPLKNGKPLSNDSTDPNGSLLNGLKSKKQTVRVGFSQRDLEQLLRYSRLLPFGSSPGLAKMTWPDGN